MQPSVPSPTLAPQRGRSRIVGIVVVLAVIAGMAALAWYLGHRPAASTAGAPGMPSAGGPPGAGGPPPGAFGGGGGSRRPGTTVGIATAESTDIPVILESLGTVTPLATVIVRPQVSGVITEVRYREGQRVAKGDVLAVIDRRPFQIALQQAQAQLQRDSAELDNARVTLERFKTLQQQDSIAEQDVDTQAATVRQLEGTLASDRAAVATAQLNLDFCEIRSPIAGRTGLRVIDVGNYIGAGDASGIVVVTQIAPTDVAFTVPQDRVAEIQLPVSQNQTLAATALDRTRIQTLAEGHFLTLDNQVNTETGTVRAKARFTNDDGSLFPNQFVNLRLVMRTIRGAVTVPISAVRNGSDGDFVWRLNDDRTVSQRKVKRGIATNDRVQITEGLQIGDVVITEGGDRLREGAPVILPAASAGAAPAADGSAAPAQRGPRGDGQKRRRRPEGAPADGAP